VRYIITVNSRSVVYGGDTSSSAKAIENANVNGRGVLIGTTEQPPYDPGEAYILTTRGSRLSQSSRDFRRLDLRRALEMRPTGGGEGMEGSPPKRGEGGPPPS